MGLGIQIRRVVDDKMIEQVRARHEQQTILGSAADIKEGPSLAETPERIARSTAVGGVTNLLSQTDDSGIAQVILSVVDLFPRKTVRPIIDSE
jgi:hypothetical protein